MEPRRAVPDRLAVLVALSLAAASVAAGLMYTIDRLRVGNAITAVLPADTALYVHIRDLAKLEEAVTDLDLWETSRPIRERIQRTERRLVSSYLLDLGVGSRALAEYLAALSDAHVAIVPAERRAAGVAPYDVLVFLRFRDPAARDALIKRLEPYVEPAGVESGTPIGLLRRGDVLGVFVAVVEGHFTIAFGSDVTLRHALRASRGGIARSLDDLAAFRSAYRGAEKSDDVFAFAPASALAGLVAWSDPTTAVSGLDPSRAVASTLVSSAVTGIGLSSTLTGGLELGRATLVGRESTSFQRLADRLGTRTFRALDAVPKGIDGLVALSLDDSAALVASASVTAPFGLAALVGLLDPAASDRVAALAERVLARARADRRYDNAATEVLLAAVPQRGGSRSWLLVAHAPSVARVQALALDLAESAFASPMDDDGHVVYRYVETEPFHVLREVVVASDVAASGRAFDTRERVCWTVRDALLLVGGTCHVVAEAEDALEHDRGLSRDPVVRRLLDAGPERSSALVGLRLRTLLGRLGLPRRAVDVVDGGALALAMVQVRDDRIELTTNLSLAAASVLLLGWFVDAIEPPRGPSPCVTLETRLCETVSAEACRAFRERARGLSRGACRTAMKAFVPIAP